MDRCGIVVGRCGSLWIVVGSLWVVVDRCGSLCIVVGRCGSLWVVPGFSNYVMQIQYTKNLDPERFELELAE